MRCYAPDPAGEANSAPSDLLAEFWGEERKGKGSEKEKGRRGKCERERKRKRKRKVGEERRRRQKEEVREKQRKMKKRKGEGKGGILCSCDFSLRKALLPDLNNIWPDGPVGRFLTEGMFSITSSLLLNMNAAYCYQGRGDGPKASLYELSK